MERYKGIAKQPDRRHETLREFEERIIVMKKERKIHHILPVSISVTRMARELLSKYCLKYTPPQDRNRMEALICDMLIAATALLKGFPVVTFNTRDFEWIGGLQVLRPDYEPEESP
jgi:predicted nucleic acid-binding protein